MQVNGVCTGAKRAAMGPAIISSSTIDPSRSMGKILQVVWLRVTLRDPRVFAKVLGTLRSRV